MSRSWMRSASGRRRRRERSKTGYLLAIGKQGAQKLIAAEKVGDDESGPGGGEPVALPFVDHQAFRFGGGEADRHAAHLLYILDLDVTIAEAEEFVAADAGCAGDEPLDENALGKAAVIIECAVDAALEAGGDLQQAGLFAH